MNCCRRSCSFSSSGKSCEKVLRHATPWSGANPSVRSMVVCIPTMVSSGATWVSRYSFRRDSFVSALARAAKAAGAAEAQSEKATAKNVSPTGEGRIAQREMSRFGLARAGATAQGQQETPGRDRPRVELFRQNGAIVKGECAPTRASLTARWSGGTPPCFHRNTRVCTQPGVKCCQKTISYLPRDDKIVALNNFPGNKYPHTRPTPTPASFPRSPAAKSAPSAHLRRCAPFRA